MAHSEFPVLESCALCGCSASLQRSHLLPNFLIRRLRVGSGRFYAASLPQKLVQAGPTARMLCASCEQRMSRWEDQVKRVFYPDGHQARLPIKYDTWLQMFVLSISWRCLTFLKHSTPNPHVTLSVPAQHLLLQTLPGELHEQAEQRRLLWGNALLAESAPSVQNDQHFLFLNGGNFPHERSGVVGFTVCHTESVTGVFSQLGPICVLGTVRDEQPDDWKNTRVQSLGGKFHATKQTIPESFAEWLRKYFENIAAIEASQETP